MSRWKRDTVSWKREQLNRAAAVFEKVTQAEPQNAAAWAGLASAHDRTANPLTAADAYNRSLSIDPDQPETWLRW